ncbi:rabphilin-3A [Contarinia nasturtii]|uniref:rabphilin-3A n=1 Tax=Contarinia nasturtii TaxID=265458 RepID=UPI0012D3F50B|nr:rabphilin-3A [Contarinia nasturtii]
MNFQGRDNDMKFTVCPSDRHLALRAKLHSGWSTGKTSATSLNPAERDAIIDVIQRNELLETAERERVGKIIDRVEKIKQRTTDFGPRNCCRLCGQGFGLLSPSKIICQNCRKPVCSKCSIELHVKHGTSLNNIWLCQICSEIREMWKKTGAWFYKSLPSYDKLQKPTTARSVSLTSNSPPERTRNRRIKVTDSSSDDEENAEACIRSSSVSAKRSSSYFLERMNSLRSRPSNSTSSLNDDGFFYRKLSSLNLFGRSPSTMNNRTDATDANGQYSDHSSLTLNEMSATTSNSHQTIVRRDSKNEPSTSVSSETSSANDTSYGISIGMMTMNSMSSSICREQPMGWLDISLVYSEHEHTLDCFLLRARDLPAIEITKPPDPFARLNIITEFNKLKQKKWLQTRTVHKTRCPEFNETIRFFGVDPSELTRGHQLYVVILDEDKYGSDFLGIAKIPLASIAEASNCRMSLPLCIQDQFCLEASQINHNRGSILIALCYNTKKRALAVQIKRCSQLLAMDNNGFSDPFVKLQLKPDSHRNKKYKTSVKWRNLNPVFNEEFFFETRPNELDKQSLIITVWDKDLGKSNDFLGSLVIGHTSKGKRLKQWKDCIRLPDLFHDQWHFLSNDSHPY